VLYTVLTVLRAWSVTSVTSCITCSLIVCATWSSPVFITDACVHVAGISVLYTALLSSIAVGVGWSVASVTAMVTLSSPYATVVVFPAWFADALSSAVSECVFVTDDAVTGSWAVTLDIVGISWKGITGEVTVLLVVSGTAFSYPAIVAYALTIVSFAVISNSGVNAMSVFDAFDTVVLGATTEGSCRGTVITADTFVVANSLPERAVRSGPSIITDTLAVDVS